MVPLRASIADEFDAYLARLFPLCRSLTGEGNRQTLRVLNEIVPIQKSEVRSGTCVYDWVIPDEWNIRDAWIATTDGRRLVDFQESNLHVVSHSEPIRRRMEWRELEPHIHTHQTLPEAIPYRMTYYRRDWGFCVTRAQYDELVRLNGPFEVVIDSDLGPGSLTYAECLLPGRSAREVLLSCYTCHPSMANDSLSGVLLTAFLARHLNGLKDRRWSYRIVFVPETLGAIAYCAANETVMKQIDMGLVITTVGGPGPMGYKQSWNPSHPINRLIEEVFHDTGLPYKTYPFDIHGSDERQYSSQGFRINCATICKDRYYEYPEYHTSFDNLEFVTGARIAETYALYVRLIEKIESRRVYRNSIRHGEVMLSKHGLYPTMGGEQRHEHEKDERSVLDLVLWLLFECDGRKSLEDISIERSIHPELLEDTVNMLVDRGILEEV